MTTTSEINKVEGSGNGSATSFSFSPVVIYSSSDLVVTHVDANGVETVLSEGTGASAYAVVVSEYPGTGSITYPEDEVTPMPSGEKVVMERDLSLVQSVNLQNITHYSPGALEQALDKITYMLVQQQALINRILKQPTTDTDDIGLLPAKAARASKYLSFDASGDPTASAAPTIDDAVLYSVAASDPGHTNGRLWLDTSATPYVLKISDGTDWISMINIHATNNTAKVLDIDTAAIDAAGMFAAGVVDAAAIGAGEVGASEIATGAVGTDELAAAVDPIGTQTLLIPAAAGTATTTNGAAAVATELATNDVMQVGFAFDQTTSEKVQFQVPMPKSWDEGTVTADVMWTHGAGATTFVVQWDISGTCFGDSDVMDTAFGTAQSVSDTGGTANDMYLTSATSAITIKNAGESEYIIVQVARNTSVGSNLDADAILLGLRIHLTIDQAHDD